MEDQSADSKSAEGQTWFEDPKASNALMMLTYVFGGAGIALGIYGLSSGGGPKGLHWALPLMVGAVGIISMIRHSVFHVSDAARAGVESDPFYMIELGFANGAIGILALIAYFGTWGPGAEAALMLTYAVYLGSALILFLYKGSTKGMDGGMVFGAFMWFVQVAVMFYLAIAAVIAADL